MKWCISFDGKDNLDKVDALCGNSCTHTVWGQDDGHYMGQLEVVISYGEHGFIANPKNEGLASFSFIDSDDIDAAIDYLESIGIVGIGCVEVDDESSERMNYKGGFFQIGDPNVQKNEVFVVKEDSKTLHKYAVVVDGRFNLDKVEEFIEMHGRENSCLADDMFIKIVVPSYITVDFVGLTLNGFAIAYCFDKSQLYNGVEKLFGMGCMGNFYIVEGEVTPITMEEFFTSHGFHFNNNGFFKFVPQKCVANIVI